MNKIEWWWHRIVVALVIALFIVACITVGVYVVWFILGLIGIAIVAVIINEIAAAIFEGSYSKDEQYHYDELDDDGHW